MMGKIRTINIISGEETPLKSAIRDAATFALFFALIGTGWALGSSAMQWSGFVVAWVIILAWLGRAQKANMTIDQARKFLDELEAANDPS